MYNTELKEDFRDAQVQLWEASILQLLHAFLLQDTWIK